MTRSTLHISMQTLAEATVPEALLRTLAGVYGRQEPEAVPPGFHAMLDDILAHLQAIEDSPGAGDPARLRAAQAAVRLVCALKEQHSAILGHCPRCDETRALSCSIGWTQRYKLSSGGDVARDDPDLNVEYACATCGAEADLDFSVRSRVAGAIRSHLLAADAPANVVG